MANKIGNNKVKCAKYLEQKRRIKNKVRRLKRLSTQDPNLLEVMIGRAKEGPQKPLKDYL